MLTNAQVGAAMMAAPICWLGWLTLNALMSKRKLIELGLAPFVVAALCYLAGRIVAGRSIIDMLVS